MTDAKVKFIKDRMVYVIASRTHNRIFQLAGSTAPARWVQLMFVPDEGWGDGRMFFHIKQDAERYLDTARNTAEGL